MMVLESSNNDVCLFKSWDKLGLFDGYDDDEFNQWCKFHSYNDMAQLDYVKYWTGEEHYNLYKKPLKEKSSERPRVVVWKPNATHQADLAEMPVDPPCARLTIARAHGQIDDIIDGAASKQMCVV
ncbi:hypothetical protein RhiirA5_412900 [Rhizophagus irregularis]|uniref:Uncharacterized protein n=1 Tax=Rhizophagus irregularis TaxID=588596 RepID=A0A2N0PXP2_9GLOM|nr:hypothetical protein RhiirA5_412900 [Rhizophagus irregularis]